MRTAFFKGLIDCTKENPEINLLVGDLGFGVTKEFRELFPLNFLNVGVAEQNMTGLASGMALAGKTCITYSIGNFSTLRCLEQIRNDVCYHNLNVKIVSVGGGVSYGAVGATHHATEDLAILRSLPNMKVYCPGDPLEAFSLTKIMLNEPGPCYLRIGRAGEKNVHLNVPDLKQGTPCLITQGKDIALIATGGMLASANQAVKKLEKEGLKPSLFSMPFIKPINAQEILDLSKHFKLMVTIEDHSIIGGLGSAISEITAESTKQPCLMKIGFPSEFSKVVGNQAFIHNHYKLNPEEISKAVIKKFEELTK